jgi:predicted flap endonuclease-1-like 5' DNA nuclease
MTANSIILLIIALGVAILIIWLMRSKKAEQSHHIDTSVSAVGAASEAARNIVEEAAHTIEDALAADVKASGADAVDVQAVASNAAALMAAGGAAAGAVTLMEIGVPAAAGPPDNLRQLKGVGPKLGALLTGLGITRFDQIAAWGPDEIARVDAHLGTFRGRIARDSWIEQATLLAEGDIAGFEAKFGKLDSPGNH